MVGDAASSHSTALKLRRRGRVLVAAILLLAGLAWTFFAWNDQTPPMPAGSPASTQQLEPGTVASMDSPTFHYSDGWKRSTSGADPTEPADPWITPSGILTFTYSGTELALNLGVGDYWGYVYITVDGEPANLLPHLRGNQDSAGSPAGYRTFYEPEQQVGGAPASRWVRVHRASGSQGPQMVRVEVWRGWGQTPLRGVAIDALPTSAMPLWPGIALMLLALALFYPSAQSSAGQMAVTGPFVTLRHRLGWLLLPGMPDRMRFVAAGACFLIAVCGVGLSAWLLAVFGMAALALLSLARPALWTAAFVFSLPFYFSYAAPILPGRSIGLIDTLALLGLAVVVGNRFLLPSVAQSPERTGRRRTIALLLAVLTGWALLAAVAAHHRPVALHEWRTVFLNAGLFAILLIASLRTPRTRRIDLWLIIAAWIAGAVAVAAIGLIQYASGSMLISAEGVQRIRALYGSPNNLALYLERTFIVALALAAFLPSGTAARQLRPWQPPFKGRRSYSLSAREACCWAFHPACSHSGLAACSCFRNRAVHDGPLMWLAGAALLLIRRSIAVHRYSTLSTTA